FDRTN
ncbi:flavin oxidoreductase / NADH oxidase family protein, partial [Vibrio parahaemolyticus V-223/04]